MPKAVRRSRGRQVKTLPGTVVQTSIPAAPTTGPAGLDTTGLRRSTNVEVRPANANPLRRTINIQPRRPDTRRVRESTTPGTVTGRDVGRRVNTANSQPQFRRPDGTLAQ